MRREAAINNPVNTIGSNRESDASSDASLGKLSNELQTLKGEHDRLLKQQKEMMDLLGTTSPAMLLHDLRNLLNERALYRTLAEAADEPDLNRQ